MRKCTECGSRELKQSVEVVPYGGVAQVEATVHTCQHCGERFEGFSRIEELSRELAHSIARRAERLSAAEIRFLRKYLGYSGKDFAAFLGVSAETVSRWESQERPMQMQLSTERLIRLMALSEKPLVEYGLNEAATKNPQKHPQLRLRDTDGRWTVAA